MSSASNTVGVQTGNTSSGFSALRGNDNPTGPNNPWMIAAGVLLAVVLFILLFRRAK